jgi:ligand-binding sensor domain-containing protein
VQEVLFDYRIHPMQVSNTKKGVELAVVEEIRRKIITHLFRIDNKDQRLFVLMRFITRIKFQ